MKNLKIPPYVDFPILSNSKITLRKIEIEDVVDLVEISYYDGIKASTPNQAIEMNLKINTEYEGGNSVHWLIEDNQSQTIIGTCGFYRGFKNSSGELGCVLLPQFQGNGFMTSAMLLAIEFGKSQIGLKTIYAITDQENYKAIKLLQRLNFKKNKLLGENQVYFEL